MYADSLATRLQRLVNTGAGAKRRLPVFRMHRSIRSETVRISAKVAALQDVEASDESLRISVERYSGGNRAVLKMMQFLESRAGTQLFGAYVHGSLGEGDEITYSDFDALAVIGFDTLRDPDALANTVIALHDARRIMYEFDPLQHHGWFVLTTMDFDNYPEHRFPLELFRHAKSLFSDRGLEIPINTVNKEGLVYSFSAMTGHVLRSLKTPISIHSQYDLKSLLSEFMLLPSLYLQAVSGEGVFKKKSFSVACRDFPNEVWSIMDEVSEIRDDWPVMRPGWRNLVMKQSHPVLHRVRKMAAPAIPRHLQEKLTDEFYQRMRLLVETMIGKVGAA